jgi:hypothetical protein
VAGEHRNSTKAQLTLALAQSVPAANRARTNEVQQRGVASGAGMRVQGGVRGLKRGRDRSLGRSDSDAGRCSVWRSFHGACGATASPSPGTPTGRKSSAPQSGCRVPTGAGRRCGTSSMSVGLAEILCAEPRKLVPLMLTEKGEEACSDDGVRCRNRGRRSQSRTLHHAITQRRWCSVSQPVRPVRNGGPYITQ